MAIHCRQWRQWRFIFDNESPLAPMALMAPMDRQWIDIGDNGAIVANSYGLVGDFQNRIAIESRQCRH